MLRGINVSGAKPVKMDLLRASFEALGFKNVRSYVQSGNVVFEAKERTAAPLGATFLTGPAAAAGLKKMEDVASGRDEFRCLGTSIYLVCPDDYGRTKLSNNVFERALGVGATTRNWKTVTTLAAMAAEG
jgi:uncharacterized protein (DUF1697 family)